MQGLTMAAQQWGNDETYINWLALAVAVLGECQADTAFEKLQAAHPDSVPMVLEPADIDHMIRLKDAGWSYKGIAALF